MTVGNWGRAKGVAAKSSFISLCKLKRKVGGFALIIMPKKNRIGAYCKSSGMKINCLDFVSVCHGTPLIVSSLSTGMKGPENPKPGLACKFFVCLS